MSQRSAATGVRSSEEVLTSLAQRPDLPPRVRSLLEGLLERSANQFEHAVSRTLDELEQELFKLAERARSNEQQHARFEALREIKRGRADVAPRFLLHVESTLAHGRCSGAARHRPRAPRATVAPRTRRSSWSIRPCSRKISRCRRSSSKSEIRHSQALYALAHRFGVLAGSPAWEIEVLPLGPAQLARALRHATHCLDLGVEYRVLAYRLFDRVAMLPIGDFYEVVNGYLAKQRILAHLQSPSVRTRDGNAAAHATAAPDAHKDEPLPRQRAERRKRNTRLSRNRLPTTTATPNFSARCACCFPAVGTCRAPVEPFARWLSCAAATICNRVLGTLQRSTDGGRCATASRAMPRRCARTC